MMLETVGDYQFANDIKQLKNAVQEMNDLLARLLRKQNETETDCEKESTGLGTPLE